MTESTATPSPTASPSPVPNARRAIVLYFLITYLIPSIGELLVPDRIIRDFLRYPVTAYALALVPAVFLLFMFLHTYVLAATPSRPTPYRARFWIGAARAYRQWRLWFAFAALGIGVGLYSLGLNSYRYGYQGIADTGSATVIVSIIFTPVIALDLFVMMFLTDHRAPITRRRRIENVTMAAASLVSAASAISVFIGFCAIWCSVAPRSFAWLLFAPRATSVTATIRRAVVRGATIVLFFAIAWLANEGIKGSTRDDTNVLVAAAQTQQAVAATEDWQTKFFYYLVGRSQIYYYSLLFTASGSQEAADVPHSSSLTLPLGTLAYRADYFLGKAFRIPPPEASSTMRLNYVLLTAYNVRDRVGSAPGLIAAFNYALPFPLNVLFCALYLALVARMFDTLLWRHRQETISVVGLLLVYMTLEDFLQSPFDLLSLVDAGSVHVLLMYGLYRVQRVRWGAAVAEGDPSAGRDVSVVGA